MNGYLYSTKPAIAHIDVLDVILNCKKCQCYLYIFVSYSSRSNSELLLNLFQRININKKKINASNNSNNYISYQEYDEDILETIFSFEILDMYHSFRSSSEYRMLISEVHQNKEYSDQASGQVIINNGTISRLIRKNSLPIYLKDHHVSIDNGNCSDCCSNRDSMSVINFDSIKESPQLNDHNPQLNSPSNPSHHIDSNISTSIYNKSYQVHQLNITSSNSNINSPINEEIDNILGVQIQNIEPYFVPNSRGNIFNPTSCVTEADSMQNHHPTPKLYNFITAVSGGQYQVKYLYGCELIVIFYNIYQLFNILLLCISNDRLFGVI
jgi:hypothetical protein